MKKKYPNLLIIGAMKCGTTSLHDYLNKHPDVNMSEPKELHFYTEHSNLSESEYLKLVDSEKKIRGTTPQNYTKAHHKDFMDIPHKIFNDTPDVKFIYIVRDPFKRIVSHAYENRYGDRLRRIKENEQSGHYWKTSLYSYQLSAYLKYFKKEQFHLLTLESLISNKLVELNRIFQFLEIEELNDVKVFDYVKNDSELKRIPQFLINSYAYRLLRMCSVTIADKVALLAAKKIYKRYTTKPRLNDLINQDIVERIQNDAYQLERDFNVDISNWNLNPNLNE